MPRTDRYLQKCILWTFFDTLLEISEMLLVLANLCGAKAHAPSMLSRR